MTQRPSLSLAAAACAVTLAVAGVPAAAQSSGGFSGGFALGTAIIDPPGVSDDVAWGPLVGLRAGWARAAGTGVSLAVDLQPFRATDRTGGTTGPREYRAWYVFPAAGARVEDVRVLAGLGLAIRRFDEDPTGDRTDVDLIVGASGAVPLRGPLGLEASWRRIQGDSGGSSAQVWTAQLTVIW